MVLGTLPVSLRTGRAHPQRVCFVSEIAGRSSRRRCCLRFNGVLPGMQRQQFLVAGGDVSLVCFFRDAALAYPLDHGCLVEQDL